MEKPVILLLDADTAILESLPLDLEPKFEVKCVTTVQEAVEKVKAAQGAVAVVVVDMWLGNNQEGGLKAIQQLRALASPPEIVVLTAHPSPEDSNKCLEAGAFSYVKATGRVTCGEGTKPLIAAINHALEARKVKLDVAITLGAIVAVEMEGVTATSHRFGWYPLGRGLMHDLRELITSTGEKRVLHSSKSTGEGYLLTYGVTGSQPAEIAAVNAVEASFELLDVLANRNRERPEEQVINVHFAIHFGEVDVVEGDPDGPNVSFALRLGDINQTQVQEAVDAMPADDFPDSNYVLCSETVKKIIDTRLPNFSTLPVGRFEVAGFPGRHEVYLVSR